MNQQPLSSDVPKVRRNRGKRVAYHAARWLLLMGIAGLTYVLFPAAQGLEVFVPEVDRVSAVEVVAPFDFLVVKTQSERDQDADVRAAQIRPIYEYQEGVADSILAVVDALFAALDTADLASTMLEIAEEFGVRLTGEEAGYLQEGDALSAFRESLRRMVRIHLAAGVTAQGVVEAETNDEILLRRGDNDARVSRDSIMTQTRFFELGSSELPDPNSAVADQLFVKLLSEFFQPTILPNQSETEARRLEVRAATVDSIKDRVQRDERIINTHEIVTPRVRDRLVTLQQELLDRGGPNEGSVRSVIGQVLTNGLVVSVFWLLLMIYVPQTYGEMRHMMVFTALFAIVILVASANHRFIHPSAELIPIPFAALVITVLFNGRIAMVAAIVLAELLGSQVAYGGQDAIYVALLGGVAAALSVRRISRRTGILGSAALVTAAFALAAGTVGLRVGLPLTEVGLRVVLGASNATVSAALVFLVLPIFERWTHISTDMTLLELSDPNQPLLRRLATDVPGTYAHSVAMASLCEGACDAIGADGLLARVGCYYHDIGKLKKPLHFVENQGVSGNPHDRLPPDVSAQIIRNHVIEGLALAEEHRLPPSIKAFIAEHHGTAEISYFLDRARKNGPVSEDALQLFSYPGPKPQSAETAVCMLADGVEAALRVLEEPSIEKLRGAIDHVVKQRMDIGQLDEAPLTMGQLDRVKQEFVHRLSGMYHSRLEYPEETGGITANWGDDSGA